MLSTTSSRKLYLSSAYHPPWPDANNQRSRIPFYKAKEATNAIKPKLGNLYHRDERSFLGQLWSVWTTCKYVEKDPDAPGAMRWADIKTE